MMKKPEKIEQKRPTFSGFSVMLFCKNDFFTAPMPIPLFYFSDKDNTHFGSLFLLFVKR